MDKQTKIRIPPNDQGRSLISIKRMLSSTTNIFLYNIHQWLIKDIAKPGYKAQTIKSIKSIKSKQLLKQPNEGNRHREHIKHNNQSQHSLKSAWATR
jgi:hypothetical protein